MKHLSIFYEGKTLINLGFLIKEGYWYVVLIFIANSIQAKNNTELNIGND